MLVPQVTKRRKETGAWRRGGQHRSQHTEVQLEEGDKAPPHPMLPKQDLGAHVPRTQLFLNTGSTGTRGSGREPRAPQQSPR